MMDRAQLLDIFTREQRIDLNWPGIQREVDGSIIRHINNDGEDGFVIYSSLDESNVEDAITAQIARFESIPQDFEWKTYDYDTPADLVERLRRRGFEIQEPESLVVLDLNSNPEALRRPVPPSIVRVTAPEQIDDIVELETAVWDENMQDLGNFLKRELVANPDFLSIYISYHEQQAVSAAWIFFHQGTRFASLYGGSTLPEFRKQGHYTNLLAARAQEAHDRGYTLLSVDASPMSRPILEKHGFQYLATTTPCKWKCKNRPPA